MQAGPDRARARLRRAAVPGRPSPRRRPPGPPIRRPTHPLILVCSGPGVFTATGSNSGCASNAAHACCWSHRRRCRCIPAAPRPTAPQPWPEFSRPPRSTRVRGRRRCHARLLLGSADSVRRRAPEAAHRSADRPGRGAVLERRADVGTRRPRRNVGASPPSITNCARTSPTRWPTWSATISRRLACRHARLERARANYLGTTIVRSPAATVGRAEAAQRRLGTIDGLRAGVDCLDPISSSAACSRRAVRRSPRPGRCCATSSTVRRFAAREGSRPVRRARLWRRTRRVATDRTRDSNTHGGNTHRDPAQGSSLALPGRWHALPVAQDFSPARCSRRSPVRHGYDSFV